MYYTLNVTVYYTVWDCATAFGFLAEVGMAKRASRCLLLVYPVKASEPSEGRL